MSRPLRALLLVLAAVGAGAGCARLPARPVDPLSAEEHNDLGLAYYRGGDHEAAACEFARAVAARPGFLRALVNLGDARLAQGELEAAIAAYTEAHGIAPGDPAVANNLAWALLQDERRWPEAEVLVRTALAGRPEPRGYYLDTLGFLLLRQDDATSALSAFREALADPALGSTGTRRLVLDHAAAALERLGLPAAAARCRRLATGLEIGGADAVC